MNLSMTTLSCRQIEKVDRRHLSRFGYLSLVVSGDEIC